jgi:hypothetical protein
MNFIFVRQDTGERKEFFEDSYTIDTTTQLSQSKESFTASFFKAHDGDRIDRKPDGTYRDKWGAVWVREPRQ